jgi:hypothetical protein
VGTAAVLSGHTFRHCVDELLAVITAMLTPAVLKDPA